MDVPDHTTEPLQSGNVSSAIDMDFLAGLMGGNQDPGSLLPDDIPLLILAVLNCSICLIVILSESTDLNSDRPSALHLVFKQRYFSSILTPILNYLWASCT